jgi:hypothetical protein
MNRSIIAIYRALLAWRRCALTQNNVESNDNTIFPIVWRSARHYASPPNWNNLEGNDKVVANLLKTFNSSSLIPSQHRLLLRLQTVNGNFLARGPAMDGNGQMKNEANFSCWRIPSTHLFSATPLRNSDHTRGRAFSLDHSSMSDIGMYAGAIVMWMNQDDTSILLNLDLSGAIRLFIDRYRNGPMGMKRTKSVGGPSLSCSSILSSDSSRVITGPVDVNRASSDARMIIDHIDKQMGRDSYRNWHKPSNALLTGLIETLSRGTFLFPPNDEMNQHSNDNDSLITIIYHHIPIRGIDDIILEYVDSGVHGYALSSKCLELICA